MNTSCKLPLFQEKQKTGYRAEPQISEKGNEPELPEALRPECSMSNEYIRAITVRLNIVKNGAVPIKWK